jgi:hypothetical protein
MVLPPRDSARAAATFSSTFAETSVDDAVAGVRLASSATAVSGRSPTPGAIDANFMDGKDKGSEKLKALAAARASLDDVLAGVPIVLDPLPARLLLSEMALLLDAEVRKVRLLLRWPSWLVSPSPLSEVMEGTSDTIRSYRCGDGEETWTSSDRHLLLLESASG